MPITLAQKLKIKPGNNLITLNAPPDFLKKLKTLPDNVKVVLKATKYDQVHWFVLNKKQMEKELNQVLKLVKENVTCWTYYPKGTSNIQTDLTRDKGWESLLKKENLQWISLISFDETWSTFGFRLKAEADQKREAVVKPREIFNYINAEKKEIRLPADLAASLKKNKVATTFFKQLSFSNKKEYVEWIITAKREETRKQRVDGAIERLLKEWKNPRNQ